MPKVPTYDNFTAQQGVQPAVASRAPVVQDTAGQQAQQLGQGLMRTGDAMGRIALDMQNEANQLRIDDALNQAKEAANRLTFGQDGGYTNLKGVDALNRQSGKPLADEYGDTLKQQIEQISGGLGNGAQRQAFTLRANDLLTGFKSQAMQYEAAQFREYALSVREGTISNRINSIGLNYNNPQQIDQDITSIQAATYDLARMQGKSAEWAEARTRQMTSKAHTVALSSALEKNDIAYADAYLKKYKGQMEADDILRVQGLITKEMDTRVAITTAGEVIGGVVKDFVPSDLDRVINITMGTESGGRRYGNDGQLLTSPKGAKGEMQVLDGTNTNPGFGVKPARDNSPEERARVGRDYLKAMIARYDGDLSKAWAAYNAGPGTVDSALAKVVNPKYDGDRNWLNLMPDETQAYVKKNMAAYGAGQGQPARPSLAEVHAEVRRRVGTDNPQRLKLALDEADRRYGELDKAVKQRDEQITSDAMRALVANGGDFNALPASLRANVPPDKIDNLMTFAKRVSKGDDATNEAVYLKLASNPDYLRGLSDNEFYMLRGHLSESDFQSFAKQRGDMRGGKGDNGPGSLNTSAINSTLSMRLNSLGIDPTPKDQKDQTRVGAVQKFVRDSIIQAQQISGKKMNDVEVEKHIDALFAKSQEFRNVFMGFTTSTSRERLLTMRGSDIPKNIRDRLNADFKASGVTNPTEADLLGAYWNLKFNGR